MTRLLNNPYAVATLVAAAVVLAFWPRIEEKLAARKAGTATAGPADATAAGQPAGPVDALDLSHRIRQAFAAHPFEPSSRNPFAFHDVIEPVATPPPGPTATETQSVRLAALWLQEGVSLALLDDRIAAAGDSIGFVGVAEVSAEGVWLVHRDNRVFVRLGEQVTFEQATEPTDSAQP